MEGSFATEASDIKMMIEDDDVICALLQNGDFDNDPRRFEVQPSRVRIANKPKNFWGAYEKYARFYFSEAFV